MADKYIETIFQHVMERIKSDNAIISSAFNLWFGNCKIVDIDSRCVYLSVENETKRKSILSHYKDIVAEYFRKELGFLPEIEIEIDEDFVPKKLIGEDEEGIIDFSKPLPKDFYDSKAKKTVRSTDEDSDMFYRRNNDYTFENYVVGSSNSFVYNAAKAVAEKSSREFNPLFIYGPSGIGKTHVLYAIANKILEMRDGRRVVYVKGEEFTNDLINSIKEGTMNNFRTKYRSADVLLVDDIQFIAGKNSSQEEFFHTFDVLYENNKQIIMTSDKPPAKLEALTKRLASRFENGLIADIEPPDFELRIAILRSKAQTSGLWLSDEILEFLADKLHTNIREIEGIIKKFAALNFLSGIQVDMDVVKECVKDFIREDDSSKTMVEKIISDTSEKFEIPVEEILGRKRDKQIQLARNVSMYIIRELTELSLPEIGMLFQRKHSTVKSNIDSLAKSLSYDVYLEKAVDEIIKAVRM